MSRIVKNNQGQSFIEFVFLLVTMMGMSFLLLKGVNGGIADRWQKFVAVITDNPPAAVRYRNEE